MNAFPEFVAAVKNSILSLWRVADYEHGKHKENSLKKHLGVASLSDCDNYDMLLEYEVHLKGEIK